MTLVEKVRAGLEAHLMLTHEGHNLDCAARNEGQSCCLDPEHRNYEALVRRLVDAIEKKE
jgi:hypothetical protein